MTGMMRLLPLVIAFFFAKIVDTVFFQIAFIIMMIVVSLIAFSISKLSFRWISARRRSCS